MARRGLTAERVVDEAARIADADGLGSVTLSAVAATLGVRTPSLYNYVSSHADLMRALAVHALRELDDALRTAAVGRAGARALAAVAWSYRDYAGTHPGLYAATIRAPTPDDEEYVRLAARPVELISTVLAHWGIEGDDALHQVRLIRSALHGFLSIELAGGFGLPLSLDVTFERLTAMLIAGIEAAGPAQGATVRAASARADTR